MAVFYKYQYTNKRKNIHPWQQVVLPTAHLNKGRAMEEHPLVALIVVFLGHLSPPVTVLLPQFGVPES